MPTKAAREPSKKPRPCLPPVPPVPPKPESSLYKAIRERLEAKDRETLCDRTQKAVEHVEAMLFGGVVVGTAEAEAPKSSPAPWSLDGLVVDPGVEAVGECGLAWDSAGWLRFALCKGYNMELSHPYETPGRILYEHFALLPDFPIAELLKRTTGYEAA